jgi:hypothetical protein
MSVGPEQQQTQAPGSPTKDRDRNCRNQRNLADATELAGGALSDTFGGKHYE